MNEGQSSRRVFLKQGTLGVGGLLFVNLFPETLLAAHREAQAAAAAGDKFTFLTPEEAADVRAFAAQVIPTDDTPGATESNVVYFIDNVLTKYEPEHQADFRKAVQDLNTVVEEENPSVKRFSALTSDKQVEAMRAFEDEAKGGQRGRRGRSANAGGFQMLRAFTVAGFLADPALGGNKDMVGWQLIGFDGAGMHEPPFGYYDAELLKEQKQGGDQ